MSTYRCTITPITGGDKEEFSVAIYYLGRKFNLGKYESMVDASQAATDWYVENYNESDTTDCSEYR